MSESDHTVIEIGHWKLKDKVGLPQALVDPIVKALAYACESKENAQASFSHYQVGGAALISNGQIARGRNLEYGAGFGKADARALHSEEAVVANAVEYHQLGQVTSNGARNQLEFMALVHNCQEDSASCGNCLDIQATYAHPDTIIVNANDTTHVGTIVKLSDAFPTAFHTQVALSALEKELLEAARLGADRSFDLISAQEFGKRGAAVRVRSGAIFTGAHIDGADYHPISSVTAAIVSATSAGKPHVEQVLYVSDSGHISGRDRQFLYQIAQALGTVKTLPVLLVAELSGVVNKTTPIELLPYGFGYHDIGLEDDARKFLL